MSTFLSLRDATWNTLLIMDMSSEEYLPIGTSDHRGEDRTRLHIAAKWLGLESKTKKVRKKQYVEVRRMQSDQYDDKPVFDMHTHTQKFIPEHYKGKKKVEAQVSKHGCLASSRDVDICVSVYHDGRYCDECLREGAYETDPDYCSKWELPWIPRRARKGGDIE